jgi:hypothetical protein
MTTEWNLNEVSPLTLDLQDDDLYGVSGFRCSYAYVGSSEINTIDPDSWKEAILPIDEPKSIKSVGDVVKGSKAITVDSVDGIEIGMVFKVKDIDQFFYVENIDTDNKVLYARREFTKDISDGSELNQVGNTGVYSTTYTPTKTGIITFIANNPSIKLQNTVLKVKVTDEYDRLDNINKNVDSIKQMLIDDRRINARFLG